MNVQDTALITIIENNALGLKVGELLRGVLSDDPETRRNALAVLTQHPGNALALFGLGNDELGLTERGASNAFDEVLGAIESAEEARDLMQMHLTSDRLAELVVGRGDLPSVAAQVVDIDTLVAAIAADMVAAKDEVGAIYTAMCWATKLIERDDYEEVINREIQAHTLRWYLIMAVWNEACCPEEDDEIEGITDDRFVDLGLDPDDSRRDLYRFLVECETTRIEREEWKDAGLLRQQVQTMLAQGPLFRVGTGAGSGSPSVAAVEELDI